jgi:hypothetical protein
MQNLKPFTPEIQASHLNLLANGQQTLKNERNKNLPIIIGGIGIILIAVIINYYESQLNKQRRKN